MSAPIVVGFDPHGADDGPVHFGIAAARFTGAPLVDRRRLRRRPVAEPARGRRVPRGVERGCARPRSTGSGRALEGECGRPSRAAARRGGHSAARGLTIALEDEGAGLAVVGATARGASAAASRQHRRARDPRRAMPGRRRAARLRGRRAEHVGVAYTELAGGRAGAALGRHAGAGRRGRAAGDHRAARADRHDQRAPRRARRRPSSCPEEIAAQHRLAARGASVDAAVAEAASTSTPRSSWSTATRRRCWPDFTDVARPPRDGLARVRAAPGGAARRASRAA